MHEDLKKAVGIEVANCSTCAHLSGVGDDVYIPFCEKYPTHSNLKTFPFKREQKCWSPEFWLSKYSAEILTGSREELARIHRNFSNAVKRNQGKG